MNKTIRSILLVSAIALPALAQAQGYVGLGIGQSKVKFDDVTPLTVTKDTDTAYKLFGGYQFTPNWGAEAGFANFGKASVGGIASGATISGTAKARAIYIAATGTLPLSESFSLIGKLGYSRAHASADVSATLGGVTATTSDSGSKSSRLFGFGAKYNFTKQVSLALEYEDFGKVADDTKVRIWTLGARYAF